MKYLGKQTDKFRDTYKNMNKEDKIRGKTKSKGKFKNNLVRVYFI